MKKIKYLIEENGKIKERYKNDLTHEYVSVINFKESVEKVKNQHPLFAEITELCIRIMLAVIDILSSQEIRD